MWKILVVYFFQTLLRTCGNCSGGSEDQGGLMPGSGGALAPCPRAKIHPAENQTPEDAERWRSTQGGKGRGTEERRYPRRTNTPSSGRDLGAGRGRKMGGHTVTGNGGRRRHADRGAEISVGGWRVVGAGDVQVDGASLRERRWGAGARERGYDRKHY